MENDDLAEKLTRHFVKVTKKAVKDFFNKNTPVHGDVDGVWTEVLPPNLLDKATQFKFGDFYVEKRSFDKDLWAIVYKKEVWSNDGKFVWEPSPSERFETKNFLKKTRFSLKDAVDIAQRLESGVLKDKNW